MQIVRAYKTELNLNSKQQGWCNRCAGSARFVFNWALADRKQRYEQEKLSTNRFEQKRRFNAWKRENAAWLYTVPYTLQDQEFINVDLAYQNFFRRVKRGETLGYPRFKRKNSPRKFTLRRSIHIKNNMIKLPRIGWLRLKERGYLPSDKNIKILSANLSERAGRWYVSLQVREEIPTPINGSTLVIGVDFGIKTLAVLSNGDTFENPKPLYAAQHKLKRLQRELARRTKGGQNWKKTRVKLQKQHAKVANARKHVLHQISHHVIETLKPKRIVLENLNVSGMMKNHCLAKAIADVSFAELRRQIEYKAHWNGIEVVLADRWYASTKVCSGCGCIKDDLTLADREYICEHCGLEIDRDLNAARNLAVLGEP